MDVKFISTTSDKLSELSIIAGQLIYLSDIDASYYDMGGARRALSSVRLVSALPSTSAAQSDTLYGVVDASGGINACMWDASASTYRSISAHVATVNSLGLVQPDGTTITIDANGVISASGASSMPSSAVTYDNTVSGLAATNAQAAIDEVNQVAVAASTAAAHAASVIASYEARLVAVEAVAEIALTTEGTTAVQP